MRTLIVLCQDSTDPPSETIRISLDNVRMFHNSGGISTAGVLVWMEVFERWRKTAIKNVKLERCSVATKKDEQLDGSQCWSVSGC